MVVFLVLHLVTAVLFYLLIRMMVRIAQKDHKIPWSKGDRLLAIVFSITPLFNVIIVIYSVYYMFDKRHKDWFNEESKW